MADVRVLIEEIPEEQLDRDVRCSMPGCDKMARYRIQRDRTVKMWRPERPHGETGSLSTHTETHVFRRCAKHRPKERRGELDG